MFISYHLVLLNIKQNFKEFKEIYSKSQNPLFFIK